MAFLKGHSGLTKYLLDLPGVDINYQNEEGKTVLLVMVSGADHNKRLSQELLDEIMDMVDRRGADPVIADNKGFNALHYLCQYKVFEAAKAVQEAAKKEKKIDFDSAFKKQKDIWIKFVEFFIKKKCPTLNADSKNYLPLMYALENTCGDVSRTKCYQVIEMIMDAMQDEVKRNKDDSVKRANILQVWAENVSLYHVEKETRIIEDINNLIQYLTLNVTGFNALVDVKKEDNDFTSFMSFCHSYANVKNLTKNATDLNYLAAISDGLEMSADQVADLDTNWIKLK